MQVLSEDSCWIRSNSLVMPRQTVFENRTFKNRLPVRIASRTFGKSSNSYAVYQFVHQFRYQPI
jgi:hypothetical protein